jgi:cytoskeletal protein CcmA (bactofilin family)
MFENRKDEYVSSSSTTAETIVGTSVKLKGNLKSDGDITIDGSINGEIKTKGTVNVGPNANIIASVKAKDVNVAGTVQGNIQATDRLNITETGRVFGDICANILHISSGAVFSGKSTMVENIKGAEIEPVFEVEDSTEEQVETAEEVKK